MGSWSSIRLSGFQRMDEGCISDDVRLPAYVAVGLPAVVNIRCRIGRVGVS